MYIRRYIDTYRELRILSLSIFSKEKEKVKKKERKKEERRKKGEKRWGYCVLREDRLPPS